MKKILCVFVLLFLGLTMISCQNQPSGTAVTTTTSTSVTPTPTGATQTVTTSVETPTNEETTSSQEQVVDWEVPVYENGTIKLGDTQEISIEAGYPITHRMVWYQIPNELIQAVGDEFYENWDSYYSSFRKPGVEPEEMICVTLVKKYAISKDDFEKAIGKIPANGVDEMDELPNADIIYTFDDEIINNYYRRQ